MCRVSLTTDRWPDLQRRRRLQRSWYWYDWANSAYVTTTGTVLLSPYLTTVARRAACPGQSTDAVCAATLQVLGIPVAPGSLALYAVTVTTLLSAVLLPVVGAVADTSGRRRELLAGFAWVGAAAATAMVAITGDRWQLGVLLQLVAGICLGSSLVVYDAILCDIATPDERDRVSTRGWALGYAGGALLLVANLALVLGHDAVGVSTETAVRVSLCSAGLWWAAFTVVPFVGLRRLPPSATAQPSTQGRAPTWAARTGAAFGQLARTVRHLAGYRQTWLFLLAYLFYNDGIQTVIYAASLYGKEELGLPESALITTILVVQVVGFAGALAFGRLAALIGARRTVLIGILAWSVVIAAGYLLPAGRLLPFVGLGAAIGLVLGGTQSLSRSLFSQLVPRGKEAEYFSLYQAAERGTSWFGTLAFGLTFQMTGSYRQAILVLLAFFLIGGVLLTRVDVARGAAEAGNPVPSRA